VPNAEQWSDVSLELDSSHGDAAANRRGEVRPKLETTRGTYAQLSAGVLSGGGMGGFFDGILFHQILQWHNMVSTIRPPTDLVAMKYNMLWDGLFHAFVWVLTACGILRLWSVSRHGQIVSGASLLSGVLVGWGAFNFVEGLINHYVLGLHHVRPSSSQALWDAAFLCSGILLMLVGYLIERRRRSGNRSLVDPPVGRSSWARPG
jgi:uncharacterized membrane protein